MKKTKIFVDGHVLNGQFHGTATFLEYLYKEIAEKNKNIEIIIGTYNYEYANILFKDYSNVVIAKYNSKSKLRFLMDIPKILKSQQFDYAHFQYVIPFFKPKNCKFIVTIHDILYKDVPKEFSFSYRLIRDVTFKYAAKKADFVTTISEYSKSSIEKYFGIDGDKIHILPLGISKEFILDYDKNKAKKIISSNLSIYNEYILYVSRIEPRKNHDQILQIYLDLKLWKKNIALVIVGKVYTENHKYEELLNKIPKEAESSIYLLENLPFDMLLELYRAARVSVYPSKAEGFGIPIIESLSLAVPTLFSNTTAMSEFDFAEKYFINPFNINSLKERIISEFEQGIYSKDELFSIQANVRKKFSWKNSANKLLNILKMEK